ncbi:hypothetical protein B0J12DRAFT_761531 [Macrophomina phaseolina]|uniref:Hydroxyneurosporene synthase n=1 Tax=Macrophomina phaseolina TaxID=35725 RepID=A0ABQ8G2R0_9PEZI|nr:hypothetical protein B0J12DRAFT_761531 [Macrophomina phaseolina]
MISSYLLPFLSFAAVGSSAVRDASTTTIIPSEVADTEPKVLFDNSPFAFDAPRVSNSNESTWDWWYFDAVSASSDISVVIVSFASKPQGFPFLFFDNFTSALISVAFPDGSDATIPVAANGATVTTKRGTNDLSGTWTDTGFSFESEGNMKNYTVIIDAPETAPPHYPCLVDYPDILIPQDTQIIPGIGWANAVPDAHATANLTFTRDNDTNSLVFSDGIGYHDKNWGSIPFTEATKGWFWGHAKLGVYSVVWFQALDWQDVVYMSGYVTRDGQVIGAGCSAASVQVRPTGAGTRWPPTANASLATGFSMEFELPQSGRQLEGCGYQ